MKVVVVGAGYFGLNYIKELSHNLIAVVETDKARAEFVEKMYNIPVYSTLPSHISFDAVIVVTPPASHVEIAKPFLEAGYYVLIEKPLATSVEEALQLRKYRNRVMAGMVYLYHPEIENLKESVKVYPVNHIFTRRTNHGPVREWQDALWDLAPHDISILNYLSGQTPIGISCYREEDWAILNLEYTSFPTCTYVSWLGGPKTRIIELVTNHSDRIVFDDMKVSLEVSPLRRMLNDFLTGDWDQKCSFDAGLDVLQVLETASKM